VILSADIGGTKTLLALFDENGPQLRLRIAVPFESRKHASFEELLERFLQEHAPVPPAHACFGVAGPVIDGCVQTTNLPWQLDEDELARVTRARRVRLVNDLEATAYGLLFVPDASFTVLQHAAPRRGNIAVIAAGTGLGEALLHWDGVRYRPIASEAGHADFAPRSALEVELLRHLSAEFGRHVSYERVLSGPGLARIYAFLRTRGGGSRLPDMTVGVPDPAAAISAAGLDGSDPIAREALDLFVSIYGAEAGNCALRCTAYGGLLIGGGIAAKIVPALAHGRFLQSFRDKGRMSELLSKLRVAVSLEPFAALSGAAYLARELSAGAAPSA
jgi:glucokinase